MRIWAKIMNDDKIVKNIIVRFDYVFNKKNYERCLILICNQLDIPTPITLKYHFNSFDEFNIVKYLPGEFIEKVNFTSFVLENCTDT